MKNLIVLIATASLLAGCGLSTEELVVAGTVTYQGEPVASGEASLSAGLVLSMVEVEAGGYSIRADVEPTACAATTISVIAYDATGAVVGTQTRILGACGTQHIVDFAFD